MSKHIQERLTQVRSEFALNNIDAYVVPRADEHLGEYVPLQNERLAWISGFTGSAGMVVVLKTGAAIFVDGRYTIQVRQQVSAEHYEFCLLYTSPSPRDQRGSRMPSSA